MFKVKKFLAFLIITFMLFGVVFLQHINASGLFFSHVGVYSYPTRTRVMDFIKLDDKTSVFFDSKYLYVYEGGSQVKKISITDKGKPLGISNIYSDGKFWMLFYDVQDNNHKYLKVCVYQYKNKVLYLKNCLNSIIASAYPSDYIKVDVLGIPALVSLSPPRIKNLTVVVYIRLDDVDEANVLASYTYDEKNGSIKLNHKTYVSKNYAADSVPGVLTDKALYILYYNDSGKLSLNAIGTKDLGFVSGTKRSLPISCYDADFEVFSDKAYITCVENDGDVGVYQLILSNGSYSRLGSITVNVGSKPLVVGMSSNNEYIVSVVKGSRGEYILLWQKNNPTEIYAYKRYNLNYTVVFPAQIEHVSNVVKGAFVFPTISGYGVIIKPYTQHVPPDIKVQYREKYNRDPAGCYYLYQGKVGAGRLIISVLDNVYGKREFFDEKNRVLASFVSKESGSRRTIVLRFGEEGKHSLIAKTTVFANSPFEALNVAKEYSWTDNTGICVSVLKLVPPSLSVSSTRTYDGKVRLSVNTTVPGKHTVKVLNVSDRNRVLYTKEMDGPGMFTTTITISHYGENKIAARIEANSGPDHIVSDDSDIQSVYLVHPEDDFTVNNIDSKTYLRDYTFTVGAIVDGQISVKITSSATGYSKYKIFKVKKGENKITIPLGQRGKYTVQIKMCNKEKTYCSSWKNFTIEVYDHIDMWIGKKSYNLNGKSATMDTAPFIDPKVNRTVVPLRFILEGLGFDVMWDGDSRTIMITGDISTGERTVIMHMPKVSPEMRGEYKVYPGDKYVVIKDSGKSPKKIDMSNYNGQNMGIPFIYSGRTFVPVRFISEIFEANVYWDGGERKVTIER